MAKVRIIPDYIFRNRNPYIVGIRVITGRFRVKDMIVFDNGDVGTIVGITDQHKGRRRTQARKDELLAIAIEGVHWKRSNESGYAITKAP